MNNGIFNDLRIYSAPNVDLTEIKNDSNERIIMNSSLDILFDWIDFLECLVKNPMFILTISFMIYFIRMKFLSKFLFVLAVILILGKIFNKIFSKIQQCSNNVYKQYLHDLELYVICPCISHMEAIGRYHTDFNNIPVVYKARKISKDVKEIFILTYVIKKLGTMLIFPGSMTISKIITKSMLHTGLELCLSKNGIRTKISSGTGEYLDCIYFPFSKKKLVIISNGNYAFYESFFSLLNLKSLQNNDNYSLLSWNHNGYGNSTGEPSKFQEEASIIAVIEFASYYLGYSLENIILYGWSIGSYSTAYAGFCHNDLGGIILDAPFDSINTFGNRMFGNIYSYIQPLIEGIYDLDVDVHTLRCTNPILIVIRSHDEIMCFNDNLTSNIGLEIIKVLVLKQFSSLLPHFSLTNEYILNIMNSREEFFKNLNTLELDDGIHLKICEYIHHISMLIYSTHCDMRFEEIMDTFFKLHPIEN